MKYADINKRFTEEVSFYLANGYTINTMTMRGSQGELSKVDLTNGKEIIRIMLEDTDDWEHALFGIQLSIRRATGRVKPHMNNDSRTLWNRETEIIMTEMFYKVSCDGADYYCTKEEAERAKQIRYDRFCDSHESKCKRFFSDKALEIGERVVREKFGYKRVNRGEVRVWREKKSGCYTVEYRGKCYTLR